MHSAPCSPVAARLLCARRPRCAFVDAASPRSSTNGGRAAAAEAEPRPHLTSGMGPDDADGYKNLVAPRDAALVTARRRARRAGKHRGSGPPSGGPLVAGISLTDWEAHIDARRAAAANSVTNGNGDDGNDEEEQGDGSARTRASDTRAVGTSSARPRRDTVFHDGGNIPLQDKFGLLLSLCSVLVSVQWLIPRVL